MPETSQPPSRALVLNVMLSLLVSAAVFVMIAQLVLVPQMARQEAELRSLRAEITTLKSALEDESVQAAAGAVKGASTTTALGTQAPSAAVPATAVAVEPKPPAAGK